MRSGKAQKSNRIGNGLKYLYFYLNTLLSTWYVDIVCHDDPVQRDASIQRAAIPRSNANQYPGPKPTHGRLFSAPRLGGSSHHRAVLRARTQKQGVQNKQFAEAETPIGQVIAVAIAGSATTPH